MLSELQCFFRKTTKMKICAFVVVKIKQLLSSKCYFIDDNFNLRVRELLLACTVEPIKTNRKTLSFIKRTRKQP